MTKTQQALLKRLAEEAYQPQQFQSGLSKQEAARRIDALKREIELADSF
jgi:vesicle coat complex subunit